MMFVRIFAGFTAYRRRQTGVILVTVHLMQRNFSEILTFVFVTYIIMKAFNGFLMIQRQMTLKDVCGYIMLKSFIGHLYGTLS